VWFCNVLCVFCCYEHFNKRRFSTEALVIVYGFMLFCMSSVGMNMLRNVAFPSKTWVIVYGFMMCYVSSVGMNMLRNIAFP
jgi:hypothetical protein